MFNLYAESLVFLDSAGKFHPWLADSWEITPDGKTITFKLRRDVMFQDGTPFNAEAAKFNLDRLVDPAQKAYQRQYVRELTSVDKVDDYTIRLNLSGPSALMMPMLANEAGAMMSPKAVKEAGQDFGRMPVGTGPFKITTRTTGEIGAVRSDNYWQKGADGKALPYLDAVRIVVNGNSSVRLLQLQSGTAQITDQVSVQDFDRVRRNPDMQLLDPPLGGIFQLNFNTRRAPTDNPELRKALSLAVDREALVKVITFGNGKVIKGLEVPGSWFYDDSLRGHVYDPAAAKQAYARSGHSGPLTLTIIQRDPDTQIAEMIQQMCKGVGVDLKVEVLERLAYQEKTLAYKYDISMARFPLQRPDAQTQYVFSYSRNASTNYSGMQNEEIHSLVDKAQIELDLEKRKAIYVRIQQLVNDNYYSTFLFLNPQSVVALKRLQGFDQDGANTWLYNKMWIST